MHMPCRLQEIYEFLGDIILDFSKHIEQMLLTICFFIECFFVKNLAASVILKKELNFRFILYIIICIY